MARPGPECTVCKHPQRALIDLAIVNLVGRDTISRRFGVGAYAVWRHAKNHLNATQRAAILQAQKPTAVDLEELRKSEAEGLVGQVIQQRARLLSLIEAALEAGDGSVAVKAEGVINTNLQLSARLLGQLINISEHRHNLLISPDYVALRGALMTALKPFPEAAAAVAAALAKLEAVTAEEMAKAAPEPLRRPEPPMIDVTPVPTPPPPPVMPKPPC